MRALGTPTLAEVRAMQVRSIGSIGFVWCGVRLAAMAGWQGISPSWPSWSGLQRLGRIYFQLLQNNSRRGRRKGLSERHEALEIPAALLRFDPSSRQHPAVALRSLSSLWVRSLIDLEKEEVLHSLAGRR